MRREGLVPRADEVVAAPGLHVDRPMRAVMDAIDEELGPDRMGRLRHRRDIDERAERVRGRRAGDEPRPVAEQGHEVFDVQGAALPHPPPDDAGPHGFERRPGRDIGVVVEVRHDDLVTRAEPLRDAEADEADEGGRVHAEADFGRVVGVQEQATLARASAIEASTARLFG